MSDVQIAVSAVPDNQVIALGENVAVVVTGEESIGVIADSDSMSVVAAAEEGTSIIAGGDSMAVITPPPESVGAVVTTSALDPAIYVLKSLVLASSSFEEFKLKVTGLEDPDAIAYILGVEAADGEPLETAVRDAITLFVQGCKLDGTWNAIKASCILAGAKTLNGALVPLKGTAPTNFNFVAGDYNRKTGLIGDGSTKYLNTNRNNNADPQDSNHMLAYASSIGSINGIFLASSSTTENGTNAMLGGTSNTFFTRNRSSTGTANASIPSPGCVGTNRNSSASYTQRVNGTSSTVSVSSQTQFNGSVLVFARGSGAPSFANHRLTFYSVGESLDLALLDARVTQLIAALAAAIP